MKSKPDLRKIDTAELEESRMHIQVEEARQMNNLDKIHVNRGFIVVKADFQLRYQHNRPVFVFNTFEIIAISDHDVEEFKKMNFPIQKGDFVHLMENCLTVFEYGNGLFYARTSSIVSKFETKKNPAEEMYKAKLRDSGEYDEVYGNSKDTEVQLAESGD